jgi:hypothetical protein
MLLFNDYILRLIGKYFVHVVYFVVVLYVYISGFGMFFREKSGKSCRKLLTKLIHEIRLQLERVAEEVDRAAGGAPEARHRPEAAEVDELARQRSAASPERIAPHPDPWHKGFQSSTGVKWRLLWPT